MKTRGAAVQGSLAFVGLVAAYFTWQREPERAAADAVVLDAGRNEISKLRYDDGTHWVELEPRSDAEGQSIWLHLSERKETKAPERELRGSDEASKLFEKFAPLHATRALGALGADKLKELGLDAPKKRLEVTARGQKHAFQIGTAPAGATEPYVKDESDGKVYLLGNQILTTLDGAASRLVDRNLHSFKADEYNGLQVAAKDKRRELVQLPGENPVLAKVAFADSPDKPDEMAKNWRDKLWRLSAVDVLGKGELPTAGTPTVALRVDYLWGKKPRGFIELGRVTPPAPPATSAAPPAPEIYARSEHTSGWVKVSSTADELIKEGEKLVAH